MDNGDPRVRSHRTWPLPLNKKSFYSIHFFFKFKYTGCCQKIIKKEFLLAMQIIFLLKKSFKTKMYEIYRRYSLSAKISIIFLYWYIFNDSKLFAHYENSVTEESQKSASNASFRNVFQKCVHNKIETIRFLSI